MSENPQAMPGGWRSLLEQEGRQRLVLLLNHVLGAEPVAVARLKPHAGARLTVLAEGWPRLLQVLWPQPAPLEVRVTPAGLLELMPMRADAAADLGPADLEVQLDTSDPAALAARVMAGGTPSLQLRGDAQLAADVNWLAENLRWDVAADLERLFGPVSAQRLSQWGSAMLRALQQGLERLVASRGAAR